MGSVSLPVKVFCWLGWNEHSIVRPSRQRDFGAVSEAGLRAQVQRPCDAVKGERAECDDDPDVRERCHLALQVGQAVIALFGQWLVARRGAADDGGDIGAGQAQAVVAINARGLAGEAGAVQCAVEPVARAIAREDAARCGYRRGQPAQVPLPVAARRGRRSRGPAVPSSPSRHSGAALRARPAPATRQASGTSRKR